MPPDRRRTLLALVTAGLLWGTTVPLTKVALDGFGPAWVTTTRLALAGVTLAVLCRPRLRKAAGPAVLAWGAVGYGAVFTLQNTGVARTSVSHAALLVGTIPILVAILAAAQRRRPNPTRRRATLAAGRAPAGRPRTAHPSLAVSADGNGAAATGRPPALSAAHPRPGGAGWPGGGRAGIWIGLAAALAGVIAIGADGGGAADPFGDLLVLGSLLLNAVFLVAQPALLNGRDALAVTAVQLLAGAAVALPAALLLDGAPAAMPSDASIIALVSLAFGGTLVPYALFTWAQARTSAELAGAFLNLEPLVGVLLGAVAFGDPTGPTQLASAAAIVAGLALTTRHGGHATTGQRARPIRRRPRRDPAVPSSARTTWVVG